MVFRDIRFLVLALLLSGYNLRAIDYLQDKRSIVTTCRNHTLANGNITTRFEEGISFEKINHALTAIGKAKKTLKDMSQEEISEYDKNISRCMGFVAKNLQQKELLEVELDKVKEVLNNKAVKRFIRRNFAFNYDNATSYQKIDKQFSFFKWLPHSGAYFLQEVNRVADSYKFNARVTESFLFDDSRFVKVEQNPNVFYRQSQITSWTEPKITQDLFAQDDSIGIRKGWITSW